MNRVSVVILKAVLCFSMLLFVCGRVSPSVDSNLSNRRMENVIYAESDGAPTVEWNRTYGGAEVGSEQSVVQTNDGGYAMASTADFGAGSVFWLIKTDSSGNAQWNKTYGGTASNIVARLIQTGDGGYTIIGNTNGKAWLVKTDSSGNMQWNNSYTEIDSGWGWGLIQTIDGGYVVAGMTYPGYDGWLMKTDANGNMQWSRTFVEVNNTELHSVVQTNDGGYVAAGATQYPPFSGKVDAYVVKTDSDGNVIWSKEFSRTAGDDNWRSIVQTSDGGYAIVGHTDHWGNADFWLIKTDASGNFLWDRTYGGTGWDGAKSIVQTSDGGYILAGQTNSFGAGGNDLWLVKTDASGNMQWNETFGGAGDDGTGAQTYDVGCSLVQTHDGGYALCGYTNSFSGDGSYEVWLIKLAGSTPPSMNWLEGWKWRKSHIVNNATGAGSNYQVKIIVVYGTGTDSGEKVYVNGKCQPDFSDIRFTDDDGTTLQNYWLQSKYEGENATFWIKIDADLSSTDQRIYMYYGNRAVSTTSSFDGTLIFGDPFDNSSLDTSRWTSVDGVTAYNMNPTEHYLEVTDMAPNQGTGVGFHSRNISMPSYWIIQDAYSDQGFVIYHESEASSDMFGQLVSLQNLTNVGSHGGAAYVMVHDGWVGDADVSDSAIVGSDSWDSGYWLPPMPYTTRWTMKRDLDGVITLSQNGIDRIARASNDTTDRMTWELERYENPGAGFGTERLYAFMVRKYVSPEPLQGIWGGEERKTWIVDDDGPADFSTIQEAINAANDEDTVFVRNGTYYEHVMVNKTLILSGEDRNATIIDGEYKDPPEMQGSIVVVVTDNVRINGFTLQHCRSGGNAIRLEGYVNMTFSGNIITGCNEGVRILHSSGNFVSGNIVQDCYYNTGIGLDWSFNNTVQGNTIIRNHYGLSGGYDNHDNTYSENIVINNDIGFGTNAYDDRFFHNNFVNNGVHVSASGVNQFDDGYPSGGNYWSDYNGTDFCYGTYQNETGSDNVGDSPYVVDANNVDNYPLMQPHVPFENQTIYIRADGSIDPSGAPILRKGDLYTLTSNITCNADGIVVEKDNIVVDGSGFAFEGIGSSFGVYLYGRSNVTIKNININNFYRGIYLYSSSDNSIDGNSITANEDGIWLHEYSQYNRINGNSISGCGEGIMLYFSSDNIIVGNNVTNNRDGIWLYSASNSNVVSGNTLADNGYGIRLSFSSNNSMSGNSITKNVGIGVVLTDSSNNSIGGNNLTDNYIGVGLTRSFNNTVCHNSFLNNTVQVYDWTPENVNVWDNGCEGNFWSDYNGTDLDNDGVGDTYLPWEAVDNFPLMNVYWNPCDINHDLKVDMKDIGRSAKAFNTVPGDLLWNPHADITGPFGQPDGKIDMRDIALIARHFMETYS